VRPAGGPEPRWLSAVRVNGLDAEIVPAGEDPVPIVLRGGRRTTLRIGGIELDDRKKTVSRDGEPVSLTPREYDILKFLMQHPGEVFSPSELYRRVWNEEPYGAESTVAVHIRHLREKLEITPAQPRWIKAVWGQGYKMENA
jgi:DNA-binding response OmpR family regulator